MNDLYLRKTHVTCYGLRRPLAYAERVGLAGMVYISVALVHEPLLIMGAWVIREDEPRVRDVEGAREQLPLNNATQIRTLFKP